MEQGNRRETVQELFSRLRAEAEGRLDQEELERLTAEDLQTLVQELHVHQIELELQNDELLKTQELLSSVKNKYVRLYHSSPAGYLILTRSGTILEANETAATLLGIEINYLLRRQIISFIEGALNLEAYFSFIRKVYRNSNGSAVDLWMKRADGEERFYRIEGRIYEDDDNKDASLSLTFTDLTQLKAREDYLQFYTTVLDNVRDSIIVTDLDGKVTYWNNAAEHIFGWSSKEMVGNSVERLYPDGATNTLQADLSEILMGKPHVAEAPYRRKDGAPVWINIVTTVFRDNDGNTSGFIGVSRDISKQREAEEALQAGRNRLEILTDNLPVMIAHVDRELKYLYVNKPLAAWFGKTKKQIIGRKLDEVISEEAMQYSLPHIKQALAGKISSMEFETRQPKSGLQSALSMTFLPDFDSKGECQAYYALIQDITAERKAQRSLEESEEKYRGLIESSPFGVALYSREKIQYANEALCEILGQKQENVEALQLEDIMLLLHTDDIEPVKKEYEALLTNEKVMGSIEFRIFRTDGELRWLSLSGSRFYLQDELALHLIVVDITQKKESELQLLREKNFSQNMLDTMPSSLYIHDLIEQRHVYSNESLADTLGYSEDEMKTMGDNIVPMLIHPDDMPMLQESIAGLLEDTEDKVFDTEYRMRHKLGHIVWVHNRAKVYRRDAKGRTKEIIGTTLDITALKKAEEELKSSQKRFRTVLDGLEALVYVADLDSYDILFLNEYARKKHLRTQGSKCWELIHPGQPGPCDYCPNKKFAKESSEQTFSWEFFDKQRHIWFLAREQMIEWTDGRLVRLAILTDISRQKQTEINYKQMINSSLQGILIFQDGRIKFANKTIQKFYGYSQQELNSLNGAALRKVIHPDDVQHVSLNVFNLLRGRETKQRFECRMFNKEREVRWFEFFISLTDFEARPAVHIAQIDITERKRAEEEREQYAKELQELNESKDLFFSIIAHDLKSPFNAFLGFTEYFATSIDKMDDDTIKRVSNKMHDSARNVYGLLENLLEWSRVQTGRIKYEPAIIQINQIVEDVLFYAEAILQQKEITIEYNKPANDAAWIDEYLFRTVLRNLVSNALKFSYRGSVVTLALKDAEGKKIFSIKDNGVGMEPEQISSLFNIAKNSSKKGTEDEQGTGLGMILVQEFMTLMGGVINVQSMPGEGTTISLTLPKDKPSL